eukprot:TRINITY_DN835_c0_g1_i1.p1 TRINITY_DN835_c0_g1~~TRINITY_DN835_c0_g1_i1.p1  ORF type:complete len:219 (-),score=75.87 TRINITY_DN835_c0_g1_i1:29-685(-)
MLDDVKYVEVKVDKDVVPVKYAGNGSIFLEVDLRFSDIKAVEARMHEQMFLFSDKHLQAHQANVYKVPDFAEHIFDMELKRPRERDLILPPAKLLKKNEGRVEIEGEETLKSEQSSFCESKLLERTLSADRKQKILLPKLTDPETLKKQMKRNEKLRLALPPMEACPLAIVKFDQTTVLEERGECPGNAEAGRRKGTLLVVLEKIENLVFPEPESRMQ